MYRTPKLTWYMHLQTQPAQDGFRKDSLSCAAVPLPGMCAPTKLARLEQSEVGHGGPVCKHNAPSFSSFSSFIPVHELLLDYSNILQQMRDLLAITFPIERTAVQQTN